ncbi:hypothetical protein SEA_BAUER_63 [Arthrobacter phage Bauer]|uniref:Uncharacterized protein n=1 Tax=Arthrobacter phage Bauer TaxID=2985648 RepID=A0A9E8A9X6_9CAUD|nr:hypothetical protein QEO99_gp63 [Arthrobacter phage Bauer]UYM26612.1 hypothetical protein SEA_BAUER_63 [Arthrobacter phage Bauer]
MDLTESIAPKSDQLDAVDLLSGPRTFTIERVSKHNAEQPFNFHLAEFPRVWRPGKSMRRVIVAAWGPTADKYVGQRVTLYCDPQVQFGGDMVGGTRISHMSGIDKPLKVPLLIKRGKSATFTVQPLPDAPAPTAPVIPDDVKATAKQAAADGKAAEYIAWLTEQGAPAHILEYVTTTTQEPTA